MKDRVWTTLQTGKQYERAAMKSMPGEMDFAIEVFARGHSAGKSRTFPYEASRVGPLWVIATPRGTILATIARRIQLRFVPRPGKLIDPSPHEIKRTSSRRLKEHGSIVVCWRSHDNADSIGSLSGVH